MYIIVIDCICPLTKKRKTDNAMGKMMHRWFGISLNMEIQQPTPKVRCNSSTRLGTPNFGSWFMMLKPKMEPKKTCFHCIL